MEKFFSFFGKYIFPALKVVAGGIAAGATAAGASYMANPTAPWQSHATNGGLVALGTILGLPITSPFGNKEPPAS